MNSRTYSSSQTGLHPFIKFQSIGFGLDLHFNQTKRRQCGGPASGAPK